MSTLRRAIKSLEDNQLIQFVGLFDKRYKKFVFKSDGVDEKIPLPPFSKGELEPKIIEGELLKSPFFQVGISPELNPGSIEDAPLKSPLEKGGISPDTKRRERLYFSLYSTPQFGMTGKICPDMLYQKKSSQTNGSCYVSFAFYD